mmetsp:Transcript_42519/g.52343  ORF Transcript_42519/g.52343 Transcript_42519/m.52343 type:complete len:310 (-) Transcript_42519:41-970(-)
MVREGTLQAGVMGLVCGGLHALGPDHLATLVTFSALMPPLAAAKVGASWGLGHCFGVVAIALLIFLVESIPGLPKLQGFESSGDYVIGASMILVALYFICREDQYIILDALGEERVNHCHCCTPSPSTQAARTPKPKLCGTFSEKSGDSPKGRSPGRSPTRRSPSARSRRSDEEASIGESVAETTPLLPREEDHDCVEDRDFKSAAVGFLQGMCCPMGLVQVTYLAGRSALDTTVFIVVCVLVSIIGTATIAALWAAFTRSTMGKAVSPRYVYRGSCFFAFSFGVLWIVANFFHFLDKVNYAEHQMMAT